MTWLSDLLRGRTAVPKPLITPGQSRSVLCPICHNRDLQPLYHKDPESLVICTECRHITWTRMPGEEDLRAYYAAQYTGSHDQLQIQTANRDYYASHTRELIHRHGNTSRPVLVDFGSSYPVLAAEAMKAGFRRAIAVDYSTEAAEFASASGVELMTPDAFFERVEPATVDILRFSHVLEHLIDPIGLLLRTLEKLKPGGLVYITQPNIPILYRRAVRERCSRQRFCKSPLLLLADISFEDDRRRRYQDRVLFHPY